MRPEVVLSVGSVVKRYRSGGGVSGLSLDVRAGEVHAVVGMNGAGKSTLMRLALRMVDRDAGRVEVLGCPVDRAGPAQWARVGHAVDGAEGYRELTVERNLLIAARLHGASAAAAARAAGAAVAELGLEELRHRRVGELSEGNRRRARVAAALTHDPDLILLDEPTATLDPAGVLLVREVIQRRARAGAGVLVSSHHLDEVARVADRITVVNDGRAIGTLDPAGTDLERAFFTLVRADTAGAR